MKYTSVASILSFEPFSVDTGDASHNLGEQVVLADGRNFRYGKANSTSSIGKMQLAPAPIANHANTSVTATALGATTLTVTPGATGGNANIYAEGYAVINAGPNLGATYQIKGHAAITSSTAFDVVLFDPIRGTALTTSSKVSLVHNPYNLFVQGTTSNIRGAGVPLATGAASNFMWLQTRGVASVLCDTATTLGATQIAGAVAGSIKDQTDNLGASSEVVLAKATIMAGVDTEYRPVYLTID